jgi:hypothetical protein
MRLELSPVDARGLMKDLCKSLCATVANKGECCLLSSVCWLLSAIFCLLSAVCCLPSSVFYT